MPLMSANWRKREQDQQHELADDAGAAPLSSHVSLERVPAILADLSRRFDSRIAREPVVCRLNDPLFPPELGECAARGRPRRLDIPG
jgi:hypothetical protein